MIKRFSILLLFITFSSNILAAPFPSSERAMSASDRVKPELEKALNHLDVRFGTSIFFRIFKVPGILELWLKTEKGSYIKFKDYDICRYSGVLGPKQRQGDKQSPEGFYQVTAQQLNPQSRYHLSFNLGYPNTYDQLKGRTGAALMVHGNCISSGCFAMTNPAMDEIYVLAAAALKNGQTQFNVHAFPFKLDGNILSAYTDNRWHTFWRNLKEGYDYFNKYKTPPEVHVAEGRYMFSHAIPKSNI